MFDLDLFYLYTDHDLRETLRRRDNHHLAFEGGAMSKAEFEARGQVLGWTWVRNNPILVEKYRLRIASSVMFDWAHVYVWDGLADDEFGKCMKVVHSNRTSSSYAEFAEYVAKFTLPNSSPSINRLFSESANKNNLRKGGFTCSGSEFLTLAPIALRYFERVVAPRNQCKKWVASRIAVLQVVVLLLDLKAGTVSADTLTTVIQNHLGLYKISYVDSGVRPKHHFALHLGPMLRRFPFLLSTFVHERKHRVLKKYTQDRRSLQSWDLGAIEEITCHQLWELGKPLLHKFSTSKPRPKMLDVLREVFPGMQHDASFSLVNDIKVHGGATNAGDVVTCNIDNCMVLGELLLGVVVTERGSDTNYALVSLWEPLVEHPCWPTFAVSGNRVAKLQLASVSCVHVYSMSLDRKTCLVYDP